MRLPGTEEVSSRTDAPLLRDITQGLRPIELPQQGNLLPKPIPAEDTVGDVVSVSNQAVVAKQFQDILDQIEKANDGGNLAGALLALKDFVQSQSDPNMMGGVLQQAAKMADSLMAQMEKNPNQKFMSLDVAADFSKQRVNTDVMVYETVTFNFQMRAVTDDGVISVNMSMQQSSQRSESFMQFLSKETAMISFNGNVSGLAANPLMQEFGQLANVLLNQIQPVLTGISGGTMSFEELMRVMESSGSSQDKMKLMMLEKLVTDPQQEKKSLFEKRHQSLLELLNPVESSQSTSA